MHVKIIKTTFTILFCTFLTACMNLGQLNYKQVHMLKKEGISLTNEGWSLALPEKLLFDFDSTEIQEAHKASLNRLSSQLQKYDLDKLKIIGHTDDIGNESYNQTLSEKRAQNVANVFIQAGYKQQNIQTFGRGPSHPLVQNNSNENRAINRRVNVVIIP